jgi:hypothetical protein
MEFWDSPPDVSFTFSSQKNAIIFISTVNFSCFRLEILYEYNLTRSPGVQNSGSTSKKMLEPSGMSPLISEEEDIVVLGVVTRAVPAAIKIIQLV